MISKIYVLEFSSLGFMQALFVRKYLGQDLSSLNCEQSHHSSISQTH